jgi:flagellar basal body-associated protein FliL
VSETDTRTAPPAPRTGGGVSGTTVAVLVILLVLLMLLAVAVAARAAWWSGAGWGSRTTIGRIIERREEQRELRRENPAPAQPGVAGR